MSEFNPFEGIDPPSYEQGVDPEDAVPASTPQPLRAPKRRPGPNDVNLTTASSLDPTEQIPVEPPDEDTPPDLPGDPVWEQAERDRLGYGPSEKRTKAERDAAAARISEVLAEKAHGGVLPPDIAKVWAVSPSGEATARILIEAWGVEGFRESEIHNMAVQERNSDARMDPIRKAFVAAQKKKEEKKR